MNAVSDRLFSAATACITASAGKSCSGGLADHQANGPGLLEQPSSRPITARVVRHRNDEPAGLCREQGSTDTVAAGLSRRHAGAFREYHDPVAFREALPALGDHL